MSRRNALLGVVTALALGAAAPPQNRDWPIYGGGPNNDRYTPLVQIDASNVKTLQQAWRIDGPPGGLQTNPLVIGGVLYGYTATQQVFAADAASGKVLWTFDSGVIGTQPARGLTWWTDGHQRRLFAGVMDRLWALDPRTGRPITSFGVNGAVDLRRDLGNDPKANSVYLTSPGVVFKDLIIVGFRTGETHPAAPGWIRAYDVRSGKLRWTFHTIPQPGEPGYETWPRDAYKTAGAANNWTGMTVDQKAGLVFVPTGSAVDDMYGWDRKGDDLWADTLLALDAATGRRLWHFQGVHHDIWDRDFPSPPVLLTVTRGGRRIDALAQATKQGFVYLFDRRTGEPLFPIAERPFPPSDTPGEAASPTQPVALEPAPFARQTLTEDDLTERTPEAHAWALKAFRQFHGGGLFVPFRADQQTILIPGFDGGAEWGGQAVDPKTGVFYVNANDLAWTGGLTAPATGVGAETYARRCAGCHGVDRTGSPPKFPSLVGLRDRMAAEQVMGVIRSGRGRMPAFPDLDGPMLGSLVSWLRADNVAASADKKEVAASGAPGQPYVFTGYRKFLDPDGYPAVKPPWGTLSAIDLNTGKYLWRRPLGEYPELAKQGLEDTGSENYGGPVLTASGLLFIAATIWDHKVRAFDAKTGALLWEADLPYAGNATPAVYMANGREYLVVATSNGKNPKGPQGSAYVAFALPR
jgi:quinoprotein glucose dehydrogenase